MWRGGLAVLLLLAGCATPDRPPPAPADLATLMGQLAAKHQVCAVAVAVIKNRQLKAIETASGCPPVRPPTPNSVFQAASLSKPVFAYAVLKLVAQGQLALDTPIMHYLPQGYEHPLNPFASQSPPPTERVTDPRIQAVTVRMLLNHTSGLPNWAQGPLGFESAPGASWHYSGEGYLWLQRAVEAVTHQPLERYMAEQVFKPLGMNQSSYIWEARFAGNFAQAADGAALTFTTPIAAATLYTSAADYGKFLAVLLNDAPLLQQLTEAPVPVEPRLKLSWGLGWGLEQGDTQSYLWHWGNNPGYRAFAIAAPRSGDGLVMFTNSDKGLALAQPLTEALLPDTHRLFGFYMLRDGLSYVLCESLRLCL